MLPEDKAIEIMPTFVKVDGKRFDDVVIKDVVNELTNLIKNKNTLDIASYR